MGNPIQRNALADPVLSKLITSGNEHLAKASEQMGILASALIAASGFVSEATGKPGMAELACLLGTVGFAVLVNIGLGTWKLRAGFRLEKGKRIDEARLMRLPSALLVIQGLAFAGGLALFLLRLSR